MQGTSTAQSKQKFLAHLDDAVLREHAEGYPEAMREDYLWLGRHLRDRCQRNMTALQAQLTELKIDTHPSTISKIIQGRWCLDANGVECPPIMSLTNFRKMVGSLREHARISELAGTIPFVETETWEDIRNYIEVRRAPEQVCKFGLIIGPTGSQKTRCEKEYVMRDATGLSHHMEAPDTATMGKFVSDFGACFGVNTFLGPYAQYRRIRESLTSRSCVIIDNVQRLYKPHAGWNQPIFNLLQKWQDEVGFTVILTCVPEFEMTLRESAEKGYFEQFEGRCGGRDEFLVLPEFTSQEDLLRIAKSFNMENPSRHVNLLEKLCRKRGRIRVLFNVLQKAKRRAEREGSKALKVSHLRAVLDGTSLEDEVEEAMAA